MSCSAATPSNSSNHLDSDPQREHGRLAVQGRPPGHALDPGRDGPGDDHAPGRTRLRAGRRAGSIEAGKKADLVLFDLQRPEWQALINPINNLIYNADGRSVHTVIVDGRVVVDGYAQSFVDEAKLFGQVQEIGERLQARTGITFPRSRWPIV